MRIGRLLMFAALLGLTVATTARAATREYWIAAVNTRWDVAPNGMDALTRTPIATDKRVFTAIVYRRYTRNFARPWPNTAASADNDGIPGPLIEAEVGDTVIIHFRNRDRSYRLPHSIHVHGFHYAPSSDGAYIPYISGPDARVPFGGNYTYRFHAAPDSYGVWPYHDHSPSMMESISHGLYGEIAILRRGERPPDRRFVVFLESHLGFDTINGRAFIGNVPTFHAKVGDRVEWDVFTLGDAFHVFHVHGHRWLGPSGAPQDSALVGPSAILRLSFVEDAPGTWYYHCHVESHMANGMIGLYRVSR